MICRTATRALLALAVTASLAACGSDEEPTPAAAAPTGPAACESRAATAEPPSGASTDLAEAPAVQGSDAPPPCGLEVADVVVGSGAEAVEGSAVELKYVGAFYETGEEFDSSWSRGPDEILPVTVGEGRVIPGFEQAIYGMQEGGRRLVTIPSDLGYGPQGQGPIPGDATLVFVLDLVSVG
jgi:FKBP-type peptidyl-prolyl cis-trans isomerase